MSSDFNYISYQRHKNHFQESFDQDKLNSWKRKDTVDYWRHERMYRNLDPLIDSFPEASWLTIGDGRYGTDANYLISHGIQNVMATDISDTYLKIALEEGFVHEYQVENAESMTFENDSFDFVLCKESYHHFPRPMVALYEMIRVARKGVILIEPQDVNTLVPSRFKIPTLLKYSVRVIKDLFTKNSFYDFGSYEEVGNYVYTISEREIEKVALGLNFKMVSFRSLSDCYIAGVEFEPADENSSLFKKIKQEIRKGDQRAKNGIQPTGLLVAVIHKSAPKPEVLTKMESLGFDNRELSQNPYV